MGKLEYECIQFEMENKTKMSIVFMYTSFND